MCKICKCDRYTLNPILYQVHKLSYLGQFAAQTFETWQANSSTGNTPTTIKNSVHMATHSSSPNSLNFNMLVIFSPQNIKQGHKLELTYLYACWIMQTRPHLQISKWNTKGYQKCVCYWGGLEASVLSW